MYFNEASFHPKKKKKKGEIWSLFVSFLMELVSDF